MKKQRNSRLEKLKLIFHFTIAVFALTCFSLCGVFSFFYIVRVLPFINEHNLPRYIPHAVLGFVSFLLGFFLALFFKRKVLDPIYAVYEAIGKISQGDYNVKITPYGIKTVRRLTEELNTMATELSGMEIMRSDFVNNFSHEFKTPIISIEGFARMLKDESLSEQERREYLDIIISESHRLADLSTNILSLSKLEHQTILTDQTSFNVTEQIRLGVVLLEKKWTEKNIEFNFTGEDYTVYANEHLLQQLWINIIDNAIKFSPRNSEIEISVEHRDNQLYFTFRDCGKGMTKEELAHAFDRFYQGDIDHKTGGNGIGLPVAKKICELHDGSISISSAPDRGTTVKVTLPYIK